jgi:hypothetical protein
MRKKGTPVSIRFAAFFRGRRTTAVATVARGVLDVGNRGAVNASSGRRASTARGHFCARFEALEFAPHTGNGALFVTRRAEIEHNRLARPQSEVALSGLPSAGEVTLMAFAVLVIVVALLVIIIVLIIVVGFIGRLRGGWSRWG